ncbi:MAG: wax ester/triacylglycerol synthase family O-acyltransferase [Actinobacteria bacterium]|nr:wax ester/triacylglycerol synthase family O-acyltransferase [Actinomycetota bacterium]
MTGHEHLSSLDASFLLLENDTQQMHVGSLLVMEGPAPDYEDFCAHIASRLDGVPRYRQRVERLPLDVARPMWVDDPHFSLSYHLRHTAIPKPGGEVQLRNLTARIMSQRLDLDRPLWEVWLAEGLADGRWAVISKVHHAMIDGVSGNDILEVLLDREPDSRPVTPADWSPTPGPSRRDLVAEGAGWLARLPRDAGRLASAAWSAPGDILRGGAVRIAGLAQVGRQAASPTSVLNGPLGPHRRWAWARGDLDEVKAVKSAAGCTVNDVVLAAIAGGFRRYLIERGESVEDDIVRSMVPVSVRKPHQNGRLGNQVSAMFADLPVGVADPLERLGVVAAQMAHLKGSGMAVGVESMLSAADFVPPTLMSLGARVATTVGQRVINTVTTNIPGPQYPLYFLGRQMLEMFPYIPIGQAVRISIGIISYDGHLAIAATGDYDAVPDLDLLCEFIEESLNELVTALPQ